MKKKKLISSESGCASEIKYQGLQPRVECAYVCARGYVCARAYVCVCRGGVRKTI